MRRRPGNGHASKRGGACSRWEPPRPFRPAHTRYRIALRRATRLVVRRAVRRAVPRVVPRMAGTLAPLPRASDNPIATACLRLVTLRPPRVRSVPRLVRRTAVSTLRVAAGPYLRRRVVFRAETLRVRPTAALVVALRAVVRRAAVVRRRAVVRVVALRAVARRAVVRRAEARVVDLREVFRAVLRATLRAAIRTSPVRLELATLGIGWPLVARACKICAPSRICRPRLAVFEVNDSESTRIAGRLSPIRPVVITQSAQRHRVCEQLACVATQPRAGTRRPPR